MSSRLTVKNDMLYFDINRNRRYDIPVDHLQHTISVYYPSNDLVPNAPKFENISRIIHHIATSKKVEGDLYNDLQEKTIELYPDSSIDWNETNLFLKYHAAYTTRYNELYSKGDTEFERVGERREERNLVRKKIVKELKDQFER